METEPAGRHVLVVDDTPAIRDLFQIVLADEGYRVTLAADVPDDLNALRRLAPDLLLLDYSFSGTGAGWRLLNTLKADAELATLPVVLCTAAHEAVRERKDALRAWNVRVVLKPFELDDLVAALADALGPEAQDRPRHGHGG